MSQSIIKRLGNLLSVKSLVTLTLTAVFAVMALRGTISQDFMTVYAVVIAFYFGTQSQKIQDAPRAASRGERTSPTRLYTLGARKFFKIIVDRCRRYAYNKHMNNYSYEHSNGMCNNLIEPENNERRELRKNIRKEAA